MPFTFKELEIKGAYLIKPKLFHDGRGTFLELYKSSDFGKLGLSYNFVQDNLSISKKGVLRGLHFQNVPMDQGKLLYVLSGSIFDVLVDLRNYSKTYGKHTSIKLSSSDRDILWVPPGFAHGFQALEDTTVLYKVTKEYSPIHESGIIWNDPQLKIKWPLKGPIVSDRDSKFSKLKDIMTKK